MGSKRRPGAPADLEELRPDLFVVHNPAASPTLRGEGEREGDRFRLTTWRRDGLLARLRARGFAVLTLADQIAALPALPPATPLGPTIARPLAAGERLSIFGPGEGGAPPGWLPVPAAADGLATVALREGWVVRRRKGRGPGAYYRVVRGNLQPIAEDEAMRHGLAQAAVAGPLLLAVATAPGGWLLPELPLPAAHRAVLSRLANRDPAGWLVAAEALPLVEALLARLGLALHKAEEPGV